MKKLALLAALALMGTAAWAANSATVVLNNFGPPDSPIYYLASGTAAPFNKGINVSLYAAPVGSTTFAVVPNLTGQTVFPVNTEGLDGYFDGGVGVVPGVGAGDQAQFELRAFEGTAWDSAANKGTKTWTQATKSEDITPPNLPTGIALNIPGNVLIGTGGAIPEPSTVALGLLGAAALLIRRRK